MAERVAFKLKNASGTAREFEIPFSNFTATLAPAAGDDASAGYSVGSFWYDTTNDKCYVCLDATVGAAVWKDVTASGGVSDGDKGDVTVSGSGATWTIDAGAVTYAKMQHVTASRLLGRYDALAGACQEISLGSGLSLNSTTGVLTATGSGGTVTSVGLTMPAGFSVANSPVTTSGTLAVTTTLSGILKGDGSGFVVAVAGTDYAAAAHTHDDRYYTEAEVDTLLAGKSATGHTHTASQVTDFSEAVDDRVALLIQNGTGISWTYSDVGGTLTPAVSLATFSTSNLAEGSNLYFTDERAQDAVGNALTDSSTIDFTYSDAGGTITAAVIANTSVQQIRVSKGGVLIGTRREVNLIEGTNVTLTVADDGANDRVNVTVAAGGSYQPLDGELTAIAGLTSAADKLPYFTGSETAALADLTSFGRDLLAAINASAARGTLGLVIGVDVQAQDAELAAIAGLVSAADSVPYFTGAGTAALATFTGFGRTFVACADASAGRTALALGTAATSNTGDFAAAVHSHAWADVSKTGSSLADLATRSAGDLSSGTLPAARMPALTGDVTTSAGAAATTLKAVNSFTATDVAVDDSVLLYDASAAGNRSLAVERMLGFGLHAACQGRLSTESGVGVSPTDRTAQGTLYFTPFRGNWAALYDGTRWKLYSFAQVSLALAGLTSGKNYDVFLYDNAGTLTLELSAAWTADNTSADALALQDGVLVKSGATTRRWLGTFRATGSATTADAGNQRFVWNYYNQVFREFYQYVTGAHTYTTAAWRQWNADSTAKVEYVQGLVESAILAVIGGTAYGGLGYLSLGFDSTTGVTPSVRSSASFNEAGQPRTHTNTSSGYHTIYACEYGATGFTSAAVTLSGGIWG